MLLIACADSQSVETLKKILRDALQAGAHRIKLRSGGPVEVMAPEGLSALAGAPAIDDAYLQKLFQFLFPNDKPAIAARKPAKGALSIPNVGKLLLIAQPTPPCSLSIYIGPQGQALYDGDWAQAEGGLSTPVVPAKAAAPQPIAVATPASDGPVSAADLFSMPMAPRAEKAKLAAAPLPAHDTIPRPPGGHGNAHAPAPAHAPNDVPDADAPINFAADAGSVDVSEGQNPIDPILIEMIRRKASDLHMTCGEPYCYRVDGEITRIGQAPISADAMAHFILPIMPRRNQAEFQKINDTDFAYEIRGVGRFRVNVFRDKNGVGTVMRHIPSKILTAEQLGLPPAITKFCNLTKGLVVVTGPTGSGKSTTLAAMIDLINKSRHDHILTIEDPIEFVHPQQKCLVNQREVHKHTGSFSRALRAALREDPDIVLIGEMRDLETIAIAIETAETGHLVFGTLHTNTAVSTIDRIIDQFPTDRQSQIRQMLASGLKGVVAQTLLKKKGGGRIAAHEILVVNDAVSAMIREAKNHMIPNHMQSQKADGNLLLTECLARLVLEEKIEAEDAFRKAVDKTSLLEAFKRLGVKVNEAAFAPPAAPKAAASPVKKPA